MDTEPNETPPDADASDQAKSTGLGKGGVPPPKEYQWRKGQSGNPGGRPKSFTTRMRELLEEPTNTKRGPIPLRDVFIQAGIMRAIKPNL
jgi:hypothetical protein